MADEGQPSKIKYHERQRPLCFSCSKGYKPVAKDGLGFANLKQ
jgi:hypothetical protein